MDYTGAQRPIWDLSRHICMDKSGGMPSHLRPIGGGGVRTPYTGAEDHPGGRWSWRMISLCVGVLDFLPNNDKHTLKSNMKMSMYHP